MYKWAVYLNNKCSKEQPEALSVVGKLKKKKRKKIQNFCRRGADKLEDTHWTAKMRMLHNTKTFVP